VAGGPAVRRQGRGNRLTGWVEELQFFFQSKRTCSDLGRIRGGSVDRLMGGRRMGGRLERFFFCFGMVVF
jgi:hypothetical protein